MTYSSPSFRMHNIPIDDIELWLKQDRIVSLLAEVFNGTVCTNRLCYLKIDCRLRQDVRIPRPLQLD